MTAIDCLNYTWQCSHNTLKRSATEYMQHTVHKDRRTLVDIILTFFLIVPYDHAADFWREGRPLRNPTAITQVETLLLFFKSNDKLFACTVAIMVSQESSWLEQSLLGIRQSISSRLIHYGAMKMQSHISRVHTSCQINACVRHPLVILASERSAFDCYKGQGVQTLCLTVLGWSRLKIQTIRWWTKVLGWRSTISSSLDVKGSSHFPSNWRQSIVSWSWDRTSVPLNGYRCGYICTISPRSRNPPP